MDNRDAQDRVFAELMQRAQRGDSVAYADLLTQASHLIRKFIENRIGLGTDGDDVLQLVLLGIHRASHTFNTDRSFKLWMFAIASHKVNDYLRVHYRNQVDCEVDFETLVVAMPHVTKTPTVDELLDDLLVRLPEKQSTIVRMMKLEGYSVGEVAKRLNMSVSAVKVSAHRAYKVLISWGNQND